MNYITIGRFTLPTDLLAAFAAIFLGALVYRIRNKKSIEDWYWNSFFLYIIISKLSYVLFNFSLFLDTPFSLLYFNGGTKGQILAFAGLAVYLFLTGKKQGNGVSYKDFLPVYFTFFMIYQAALFALSQDFTAALFQAVVLAGFLLFYFKDARFTPQFALLFLLLQALVSSLFSNLLATENLLILALGTILLAYQRMNKEETQH